MADEIGQALQRVGGTAGALNIEFEKVASWVAIVSSRTRESAYTIGNSIKSMMARVQSLKERGFDEEDGTQVNQVAKALAEVGVQLVDTQGQFRNFGTVMDELGAKWSTLDNRHKAYLATTVAGTFQQSRFLNLMEGYGDSVKLYTDSLNQAGIANQKFDLYAQGTEAQLTRLKNALKDIWSNAFNSETIRGIADAMTILRDAINTLVKVFGFFPLLITTAIFALTGYNKALRTTFITNGAQIINIIKSQIAVMRGLAVSINTASTSATLLGTSLNNSTKFAILARTAFNGLALSVRGLGLALSTLGKFLVGAFLPFAIIGGVLTLFQKLSEKSAEAAEQQRLLKEQNDKTIKSFNENGKQIEELVSKYEKLKNKQQSIGLNNEENQELIDIQNELNELLPVVTDHVDKQGNAHLKSAESIKEEIKYLKELKDLQDRKSTTTFGEDINEIDKEIAKEKKELEEINKLRNTISDRVTLNNVFAGDRAKQRLEYDEKYLVQQEKIRQIEEDKINRTREYVNASLSQSNAINKLTEEDKKYLDTQISKSATESSNTVDLRKRTKTIIDQANAIAEARDKLTKASKEGTLDESLLKLVEEDLQIKGIENASIVLEEYFKKLKNTSSETTNLQQAIKTFNTVLIANTEILDKLAEIKERVSKNNILNGEDIKALNDLGIYANDAQDSISQIIKKENELKDVIQKAYREKMMSDKNFMETHIKNNQSLLQDAQNFINQLNLGYEIDLKNFTDLASAKFAVEKGLIAQLSSIWSGYYDIVAGEATYAFKDLEMRVESGAVGQNYVDEYNKVKPLIDKLNSAKNKFDELAGSYKGSYNYKPTSSSSSSTNPVTTEINKFKIALSNLDSQLNETKAAQELLNDTSNEYRENITQQIDLLKQKQEVLHQEAEALRAQQKNTKLTTEQLNQNKLKVAELGTEYNKLQKQINDLANDYADSLNKISKIVIDTFKDTYKQEEKVQIDFIDNQMKAEEKRHKQITDNLDAEKQQFDDYIDSKISALEREKDAQDYNKDVNDLTKEINDLVSERNKYSMAVSSGDTEAISIVKDLDEQIAEKKESLAEKQSDREYNLRKQNLQDIKDDYDKQIDVKKDAEDEEYNNTKDSLDDRKQAYQNYYEGLIADDKKWTQMQQDILNGNVGYIIDQLTGLESDVKTKMASMGSSVVNDFINKLQYANSLVGGVNYSNNPIIGIGNNGIGTEEQMRSNEEKIANDINYRQNEIERTKQVIENRKNQGLDISVQEEYLRRLQSFHEGGITGSSSGSSKIMNLVNKLFNVKPGEEVIKSLVGELHAPQRNVVNNFIPNMQNLISSLSPQVVGAGNINLSINVAGNADSNTVSQIRTAGMDILTQVKQQMNMLGIKR